VTDNTNGGGSPVVNQNTEQDNGCKNGASCTNDGLHSANLQGSVGEANVDQNLKQGNDCEGQAVTCITSVSNTVNIVGASEGSPPTSRQSTTASNTVDESNNRGYNVEQSSDQQNDCTGEGTSCSTTSDSTATLGSGDGSHNIEQNTQHKSKCSGVGASCSNSASSTAIIGDGGTTTDSRIMVTVR
jgi:hypothetical protein